MRIKFFNLVSKLTMSKFSERTEGKISLRKTKQEFYLNNKIKFERFPG